MKWCININKLAEISGGIAYNCSGDEIVKNVVRDDREVSDGTVFVALKGENNNGHRFVQRAVNNGAACCVVDKEEGSFGNLPVVAVDDTFKALRDIAAFYREQFNIPVVGITGSVGKTSTKGMIASVLGNEYVTLKTEGNYNNEVGVPLTIFRLTDNDEAAVIEMGMSAFGEISRLSKIVKPDTAVITNIGISHMEHLGSQEGICKAKFEILDGLSIDGTIILNGDDEFLWEKNGELDYETLYYGIENKSCDVVATDIKLYSCGSEFNVKIDGVDYKFETNAPGIHHIYNALAAILVGYRYNLKVESMIKGVHDFVPEGLRQVKTNYPKFTVINDCYNACPDSMGSGLDVLVLTAEENGGNSRKVACLADMLELGETSEQEHYKVGLMCAEKGIDCLITIGDMAGNIAKGAIDGGINSSDVYEFGDNESAISRLGGIIKNNDVIWIKGSRGMHLEKVAEALDKMGNS